MSTERISTALEGCPRWEYSVHRTVYKSLPPLMSSTTPPDSVVHRLFDAINAHEVDRAAALLAPSYRGVDVTRSAVTESRDKAEQEIRAGLTAFPDLTLEIHQCVAESDRVSVFWSLEAVHEESFLDLPPTQKSVTVRGTGLFAIREGHIVRGVHLWDLAGFLRDIQLLPDLPHDTVDAPSAILDSFDV